MMTAQLKVSTPVLATLPIAARCRSPTSILSDVHHPASVTFVSSTFGPQWGSLTAGPLVDADTTGSGSSGSVAWNFAVANSAVHALAFGQTVTETYVVSVNDGHGGTATQNVDVAIANNETLTISLTGDHTVTEGADASYTVNLSNALAPGITASVDIAINLPGGLTSAEVTDFTNAVLDDVATAAGLTQGVILVGGALTFDSTFDAAAGFTFTSSTFDDTLFEGEEGFTVALSAPTSNVVNATVEINALAPSVDTTIIDNDAANIAWSIAGGGNVTEVARRASRSATRARRWRKATRCRSRWRLAPGRPRRRTSPTASCRTLMTRLRLCLGAGSRGLGAFCRSPTRR